MELYPRIREDLRLAMKGGEQVRADVLRFLLAGLHNVEIEKRRELTDEETVSVLRKEAKRRRESIEMFRKGGREDLAVKEEGELQFLSAYLPKEISTQEIEAVVQGIVGKGASEFSVVMRETMQTLKGAADGKVVQEIVKKVIGGESA